ncbi:Dabb family protein [candidate division KSB1 bacterium]|nr:Dabb family protein [candidate division KSB1 bacterium]
MVKHIVLWKLKESAEGFTKAENAKRMKKWLEDLKVSIPKIKKLEVGINFNVSEVAYEIVLYSEFENKKALQIYQDHPEHIEFKNKIKNIRTERAVVDY